MKIGLGITSFHRPEHLELCLRQICKHTFGDRFEWHLLIDGTPELYHVEKKDIVYSLYIAKDIPNIAKAKNECLYNLRDCDFVILMDDDTFPIKDGWIEFFTLSPFDHLLYLTDRHNLTEINGTWAANECGGCFMYFTRECLNRVGYFNTEYKQYGYEHAGITNRVFKSNESVVLYRGLIGTDQYLYSLDYQGEGSWGIKHKPSITDYKAMQESIDYNWGVFQKEINSDKIYYEYGN